MYDPFAASFARSRSHVWPDVVEFLDSLAALGNPFGSFLDVGCGSGRLTQYLEPRMGVRSYRGIDSSAELIRIANNQYPSYEFDVQDMRDLRQDGQIFDTIVYLASFHHLCAPAEQVASLKSALRYLSPWGTLAFLNWNLLSVQNRKRYPVQEGNEKVRNIPFSGNDRHYYVFEPAELETLLRNQGMDIRVSRFTASERNIITIATDGRKNG